MLTSRQEAGLPADGFAFCCFNNSEKLRHPLFEAWMRVLRTVRDSVLWLAQSNGQMIANLRGEAERCSIDPARLVFATRLPLPQHLASQRLVGLFLDTLPYHAGATAVAALWSGVPVLTIRGETFVGRMAASMLHAIGLPEPVTHNLADYKALAVKLARDPTCSLAFGEDWKKTGGECRYSTPTVSAGIWSRPTRPWLRYSGAANRRRVSASSPSDFHGNLSRGRTDQRQLACKAFVIQGSRSVPKTGKRIPQRHTKILF
jgi:hypothetical protein